MKPRLLIISEIIAPYRIPVFNALAARDDVDLSIIFLAETDPGLREWRVYKDDIRFPYHVLPSWRRQVGRYNILINRGMSKALCQLNPEVLVCGGYNYIASWQALRWAKRRNIPFLLWSESNIRDSRPQTGAIEFLKRRFIAACSGFVVPGKSSLEYLRHLGVLQQPIFSAPNAVDVDFFCRNAVRARENAGELINARNLPERYFLYVGRLVPQKGVFELLEAYAKLSVEIRRKVGLVLVGDGAVRSELQQRASRISPGQIRFPGFAHREALPEYYGLAEALVLPTYTDTWGLVVNEAMSSGLPIIVSSAAGCVDDLVEDGGNGFVIPPRDVSSLTNAMANLLENPDRMRQMSRRSVERIRGCSPDAWAQGVAIAAQSFVVGI